LFSQTGETGEELAAEDRTHRRHGKKVAAGLNLPRATVWDERSTGHNGMNMGMQRQPLSPRVQDQGDADLAT